MVAEKVKIYPLLGRKIIKSGYCTGFKGISTCISITDITMELTQFDMEIRRKRRSEFAMAIRRTLLGIAEEHINSGEAHYISMEGIERIKNRMLAV
jgi:hypothetical protein